MEETLKLILEKISNMDSKVNDIQQDMIGIKQDVSELKKDVVRIENKVDEKLSALFDGYSQNTEAINILNEKVDKLVASQERQDVEIKVIHTKVN